MRDRSTFRYLPTTHGDDPTTVVSAGATITIGGIAYPDSSESTPTTVLDQTGTDVTLPNGRYQRRHREYAPKAINGTDHFHYTIQDADGDRDRERYGHDQPDQRCANASRQPDVYDRAGSVLTIVPDGGIVSQAFDLTRIRSRSFRTPSRRQSGGFRDDADDRTGCSFTYRRTSRLWAPIRS
jgi:hypothetical protein